MTLMPQSEQKAQMQTEIRSALLVGGSRGVGRDLAVLLDNQGIETHVMARGLQDLDATSGNATGIITHSRDATQEGVAEDVLKTVQPDLVVLTAGTTPKMAAFHRMSWAEFSAAWNTDIKIAYNFLTAALTVPMKPGAKMANFSSGAGLSGSRLSGGYAGAKRMQHFMTDYARQESEQSNLDLRFVSIIPKQLVQGTEKGNAAAAAYAALSGVPLDQLWAQWDAPLTAAGLASHVAEVLLNPDRWPGHTYAITGHGPSELE